MQKNLWHEIEKHPEIRVGQYIVPNFVSNSIAIKTSDSDIVIISPGKSLIDAFPKEWLNEELCMHLVMPNSFHYMGVQAWRDAFPKHRLYASKGAIKRLVKQGVASSESDITALESELPPLPFNYSVLIPPGHRGHDAWFKKHDKDSQTSLWITCDSFLNYERMSNQPIAKVMQKVLGAAPGLKMSQVIKWFLLDDKATFKQWALKQIDNDQPAVLIPSHGEVLASAELPMKLSSLLNKRL